MPPLRVLSGRKVRKILEANGFVFDRQNGSHMILVMRTDDDSKTVSVPDHKELSIGTLGGIIRESGLSRALFE
jgi:predicted RNA binding protein YcfA (HicA-like mRNA interferase family)